MNAVHADGRSPEQPTGQTGLVHRGASRERCDRQCSRGPLILAATSMEPFCFGSLDVVPHALRHSARRTGVFPPEFSVYSMVKPWLTLAGPTFHICSKFGTCHFRIFFGCHSAHCHQVIFSSILFGLKLSEVYPNMEPHCRIVVG